MRKKPKKKGEIFKLFVREISLVDRDAVTRGKGFLLYKSDKPLEEVSMADEDLELEIEDGSSEDDSTSGKKDDDDDDKSLADPPADDEDDEKEKDEENQADAEEDDDEDKDKDEGDGDDDEDKDLALPKEAVEAIRGIVGVLNKLLGTGTDEDEDEEIPADDAEEQDTDDKDKPEEDGQKLSTKQRKELEEINRMIESGEHSSDEIQSKVSGLMEKITG